MKYTSGPINATKLTSHVYGFSFNVLWELRQRLSTRSAHAFSYKTVSHRKNGIQRPLCIRHSADGF